MSRWPPDARKRLQDAAWALFDERGYETTTVAQITERAGLNRATFFRHFADKREILFGGEEVIGTAFGDGIRDAPADAALTGCLKAALDAAAAVMTDEQRERAVLRRRVAAASTEVQERGLAKNARIASRVASALRDRGVDEQTAGLGAEFLMLAFATALQDWLENAGDMPFVHYSTAAFEALRLAAAQLAPRGPVHTPVDGDRALD